MKECFELLTDEQISSLRGIFDLEGGVGNNHSEDKTFVAIYVGVSEN